MQTIMQQPGFDWSEYCRIERDELLVNMSLFFEGEVIFAQVMYKNISNRELHVFSFNLESRFEVFLNSKELEYTGPMISIVPSVDLYTTLKPQEEKTFKIGLTSAYNIPKNSKGELIVRHQYNAQNVAEKIAL